MEFWQLVKADVFSTLKATMLDQQKHLDVRRCLGETKSPKTPKLKAKKRFSPLKNAVI